MKTRTDGFVPISKQNLATGYEDNRAPKARLTDKECIELKFPDGTIVPCVVNVAVTGQEPVRGLTTYFATYTGTIEIYGGAVAIVLREGMLARCPTRA